MTMFGILHTGQADAGEVDVIKATAKDLGNNRFQFSATLKHADTGWDHYANGWVVRLATGEILGTRELMHPHENEQPFTRSLSGVLIPSGVKEVVIEAHDSKHGTGGQTFMLNLPNR